MTYLKNIIILLLCLFLFVSAKTSIAIKTFPWIRVSFEGDATVYNNSFDQLKYEDPFFHFQGDTSSYIKVLDIVPDIMSGERYSVLFHMGEGGYARFEFYLDGEWITPAFTVTADHLEFLGNGMLLAGSAMNQMFSINKKYRISNGRIREVKQPFYAVDLKSIATRDFDIFLSKRRVKIIDHVSKDENVSVLLSDFKNK